MKGICYDMSTIKKWILVILAGLMGLGFISSHFYSIQYQKSLVLMHYGHMFHEIEYYSIA